MKKDDCGEKISDHGLQIADCGLRSADHGSQIADCGSKITEHGSRSGNCVTHHHACDCRERLFSDVMWDRYEMVKSLELIRDGAGEFCQEDGKWKYLGTEWCKEQARECLAKLKGGTVG